MREKSPEVVDAQSRALCAGTGYEEFSLSSLSTSAYTRLEELLHQYPNGDYLKFRLAGLLQMGLGMTPTPEEDEAQAQAALRRAAALLEQVEQGGDPRLKGPAAAVLAGLYLSGGEFERAEQDVYKRQHYSRWRPSNRLNGDEEFVTILAAGPIGHTAPGPAPTAHLYAVIIPHFTLSLIHI